MTAAERAEEEEEEIVRTANERPNARPQIFPTGQRSHGLLQRTDDVEWKGRRSVRQSVSSGPRPETATASSALARARVRVRPPTRDHEIARCPRRSACPTTCSKAKCSRRPSPRRPRPNLTTATATATATPLRRGKGISATNQKSPGGSAGCRLLLLLLLLPDNINLSTRSQSSRPSTTRLCSH